MNKLWKLLMLVLLLATGAQTASAQKDDFDDGRRQGYWFLGLNTGSAWQQSDVRAGMGAGWGLYLGGNIFYRKTSPISLDLRFRYLGTLTQGQNHFRSIVDGSDLLGGNHDGGFFGGGISPTKNYTTLGGGDGYVFHNNRTSFHDLSLELRLNFENLRRKHRIWFSIYGGAGVGFYRARLDQLDERFNSIDPALYSYEGIDTNGSRSSIRSEIYNLRDGDYETEATDGYRAGFMAHAGVELGYWVTRNFAIGVGHRVTWTLKDDFDGTYSNIRPRNDIHHYANLFLHFDLVSGRARVNNNTNVDNRVDVNTVVAPRVTFSYPTNCPFTTTNGFVNIRLTTTNITSSSQITFTVNGTRVTNFSFNSTTGIIESTVSLATGNNVIVVSTTNSAGTDQVNCTVVYNPTVNPTVKNPPTVNIYQPSAPTTTIQQNTTNILATITNITSSSQVTFSVNGVRNNNFNFSGTNFSANNVNLVNGSNTIVVTATNPDGTASDSRTIIVSKPSSPVVVQNPPTVQITNPAGNPHTVTSALTNISANTTNITSSGQVTFTVNGTISRNFSFANNRITANNISLVRGSNSIVITVTNADGSATDSRTIIYNEPSVVEQNLPTVNISTNCPVTTSSNNATVVATTTNVSNRSQVTILLNGVTITNFSFSNNTITVSNLPLQAGSNHVQFIVRSLDERSNASDGCQVIYNAPAVVRNPPTVRITSPTANPFTSNSNIGGVNATTTNISNINQIRVTVNGQTINAFGFNNGFITISNIALQTGSNTVNIVVTNNDGTASDNTTLIYNAPVVVRNPPTVQITAPAGNPFNTNTASATVVATTTNISNINQIRVTLNGQVINAFGFRNNTITISNVALQAGNNAVNIVVTNNDGTASDNTTIVYNAPVVVRNPPTVQITAPAGNPFNTNTASATVVATTTNISNINQIRVTLNGQVINAFVFRNNTITISNINLQAGNNAVNIVVTNNDGTASDNTTIVYTAPVVVRNPPTVQITAPAGNPFNTNTASATVVATTTNISNINQIRVTANGRIISAFGFSGNTITLSNVNLQAGNNAINIVVTNNDGTASDNTNIVYTAPVVVRNPPTVQITDPRGNPHNSPTETINIVAATTNITAANQISVLFNGRAVTNFGFRGNNVSLGGLVLQQGDNTLVITVTNPDGTANDSRTITYKPAPVVRNPPTVQITVPAGNPFNTTVSTQSITATTTNISAANQISVNINGQPVTNFAFRGNTVSISNVNLNVGNNTVSITATNPDGTASDNTVIAYSQPARPTPPTVQITAPRGNPHAARTNSVDVTATTTNITAASQINFTLNGTPVTNFSFRNNTITATGLEIQQGNSSIVITVTNSDGSASDNQDITFSERATVTPPQVNITTPASSPANVGTPTTTINATILHVSDASGVTFRVNGQASSNFQLLGTAFTANNVRLNKGSNTIEVVGTNAAGTASDNAVIVFAPLSPPPTVQITNPAANPHTSSSDRITINATIQNVSSANEVTFTVNGTRITNFSLRGTNFNAPNVALNAGSNSVSIVATTTEGTANDSRTIQYAPPAPTTPEPIISNMNALQQQVRGAVNTYVIASIQHATSASQIVFTANGQRITNFSFSGGSFRADNVPVQNGTNTYTIVVTNAGGTATMSATLNYNGGSTGGGTGGGGNRTVEPNNNTNPNNTGGRTVTPTDKGTTTNPDKGTKPNNTTVTPNNKGTTKPNNTTTNPDKGTTTNPDNKGGKMGGDKKPAPAPTPENKGGKMGGGTK